MKLRGEPREGSPGKGLRESRREAHAAEDKEGIPSDEHGDPGGWLFPAYDCESQADKHEDPDREEIDPRAQRIEPMRSPRDVHVISNVCANWITEIEPFGIGPGEERDAGQK